MDFKALNLSQTGVANDSFISRPLDDTASQFDISTDRNIIGRSKIRVFNFSQGNGGTVTLGGTANGNGMIKIKNSLGSVIVQGDNTGLSVTSGSITINNSNLQTILDSAGVVSTVNFPNDQIIDTTLHTTTGTAYSAVPGASLNAFNLPRSTNVLINLFIAAYNNDCSQNASSIQFQIADSSAGEILSYPVFGFWALQNINFGSSSWTTNLDNAVSASSIIYTLAAGTHTLNLNYKINGGGTAKLNAYVLSYIILGT